MNMSISMAHFRNYVNFYWNGRTMAEAALKGI